MTATNLVLLPTPASFDQSSKMWVDEAIWGHRLYDEQIPWMIFLEFLTIFNHEADKGRAFQEPNGFNTLQYKAPHRLYLRNILFNNPHLPEILSRFSTDEARWGEWFRRMSSAQGIAHPHFEYLKDHFQSFENFCDIISLVRSTGIEVNSNKRWTSKFVFPYGKDCGYEDLDAEARTNDRRFFARTGELLYLMFCRSNLRESLCVEFTKRITSADKTWNDLVRCLQPGSEDEQSERFRANSFLPYEHHFCFDQLAEDWLCLLKQNIPDFDIFPHLVNLVGLHFLLYQLRISKQVLGEDDPPQLICEIVSPKKTLVRELSCDRYQANNLLPARAIEKYISNIESSDIWKAAILSNGAYQNCLGILQERVKWGEDYNGPHEPQSLIAALRQEANKRHHQHVSNIHRNYGKEIGLVSKRGTVKLRYAPSDGLLKTLLFANVVKRSELHLYLKQLYVRYGLVFGDKEAEEILPKGEFEKKPFQANSRRLEQRLGSLGLLKRLSDGCAYVVNPF